VQIIDAAATAEVAEFARGKAIAFDRNKGNCLSCHIIEGGELPGNSAPPLLMMKLRYPDKTKLRAQIADATQTNPETIMPPYARHHILTEDELNFVVDYIHSL
jgi:sulfur-oxidizing protein SoxX